MRSKNRQLQPAAVLLLVLMSLIGCAEAVAGTDLGVALIASSNPYIGKDDDLKLLPYISYRSSRLQVNPFRLSYQPWQDRPVKLVAALRYENEDIRLGSRQVKRIDPAISAGLNYEPRLGPWSLVVQAVDEISSEHHGYQLKLGLRHAHRRERWMLRTSLALVREDRRSASYYYGIDSALATPEFPAYLPGQVDRVELGLRLFYMLDKSSSLATFVSYRDFPSAISDSPLVDDNAESSIVFAWLRHFR